MHEGLEAAAASGVNIFIIPGADHVLRIRREPPFLQSYSGACGKHPVQWLGDM